MDCFWEQVSQNESRANLQYFAFILIININFDQLKMSKHQVKKKKRILLKGQDKYDKIVYRQKMLLLKGVFIDKAQIKQTAEKLGINYSTAKTFLRKFKARNAELNTEFICDVCNWFQQYSKSNQRCGYRSLADKLPQTSSNSNLKEGIKEQDDSAFLNYVYFQKNQNGEEKPGEIQIIQQVLFKD